MVEKHLPFMDYRILFVLFLSLQAYSQDLEDDNPSYIYVEGDSIPKTTIELNEVLILKRLSFNSKDDLKRYYLIKRKTLKVYEYARLASERLDSLETRFSRMSSKREKKRYAKLVQKYIDNEFSTELKKLTRSEGRILIKLIHRQTGSTAFELIKTLRSGWNAFWFNNTAKMFDLSLKSEYDPYVNRDDFYVEDILQRAFQNEMLIRQPSKLDIDYYDIKSRWENN